MKKISLLFALAGTTASVAMGQPAADLTFNPLPAGTTSAAVTLPAAQVRWINFVTTTAADASANTYLDIAALTGGSSGDTELGVYANDGTFIATDDDDGPGRLSLLSFGSPAPGTLAGNGTLPPGNYWLAVGLYNSTFGASGFGATSTSTASGAVSLAFWQGTVVSTVPGSIPTPSATFSPLTNGVTTTILSPRNAVQWIKFVTTLEASVAGDRFVDISTTSGDDTEIGLYDLGGNLVAQDDDDGPDSLSLLSFGTGSGVGGGTGADGTLPAGEYYLAVAGYNALFNPLFGATTTGASRTIGVRFSQGGFVPPSAPTPEATFNLVDGNTTGSVTVGAGQVKWVKFVTTTDATTASNRYLTIATTAPVGGDTEIGVYSDAGARIAINDDSTSALSFLSFGAGGTGPGAFPFDGFDGPLAAGTYYLALGFFNTTFNATVWDVSSTSTLTGDIGFTISSGLFVPTTGSPVVATFNPLPAGNSTATATVGPAETKWIKFVTTADASVATSKYVDISTVAPVGGDTEMAVYSETGARLFYDDQSGDGSLSALSFGTGANGTVGAFPFNGKNGTLVAGTYYLALTFYDDDSLFFNNRWGAVSASVDSGDIGVLISSGDFVPTPPPPAVSLTIADGGTWATGSASIDAEGDVKWFSFVAPAGLSATGALDIDVQGTALTPANDTDIGLYRASTTGLVASDEDSGTDLFSQLSFGAGRRIPTGNGQPFRGQNGTVGTGNTILPGETYYLAVAGGNAATHAAPFNTAGGTNTGTVVARVRAWSSDAPSSGAATPPASTDLGTLRLAGATENIITSTWTMTGPDDVKWFKLTTTADALNASTSYVDIDTDNTSPDQEPLFGNLTDTYLGVYNSTGTFRTLDDDDGISDRSAISYGDNVNVRTANVPVAPNLAGEPRNGRDGDLPAGTYYIVVTTFLPAFYADYFDVAPPTNRTAVGDRVLAVRTNFATNACPNPSNIAGPGQSTTPDEELTADDIIVFLNWFFANDSRANVSGPGQNTTQLDNDLTADDIIVFLNRFFAGC
ncbi:MAG: GC-type dockerin domain-anchored protein [bacterium]